MSQKVQKTIEINARVKTSLEGMSKTIQQLEDGLSKQKFDLGKTSGLSKLIKDYKEAKTELDELMQGDQIARTDIKKAENLGDKVSKLYKKIATSFKELQGGNEEVFKNLFPSKFVTQITKGTQAIDKFFQKLDTKGIKTTKVDDLTKEVQTLETELSQLKNRRIKVEIDADKEKVSKELQRINNEFDNMRQNFKKKLFPDEGKDSKGRTTTQKLDSSVATWSNKLAQDREARKNLKVADLTKAQKTQITKLEGQLTDSAGSSLIENEKKRLQALQAEQRKRETIAKTPGARDTSRSRREYGGVADKELSAQIAASEKELQRLKAIADKIEDIRQQPQKAYDAAVKNLETRIKTDRTNLEKAEKALAEHQTRREEEEKIATQKTEDFMSGKSTAEATQEEIEALKKLNQERQEAINLEKKLKQEESFKSQESKDSAISKKESTIANKRREIEALSNEIKNLTNETNLDEFFQKLGELGVNTEGIEHTHEGLEQIRKDLKDLNAQTTEAIRKQLLELGYDFQEADKMVDALGKGMEELGDKDKDLSRAENEMENLKNQVLQFFSITNSIQLFKRAVMSALNTVKELDATMTEAAVVTDFSVSDMWDKLPEYSANAQKLGVSINGMYQATTLYYQQGLKSAEAMELGIETMKMARIASIDSAEATKAMTSALRGFNMELSETSATRVNDVYSQLAAVTAADTAQIATAMEKTASIAANANMEFETTAALLAQIIETTQEAPETAGTAMKTIIARFSEVKKLKDTGETTGKDTEGEEIDVNKIQTALKTVGISMDNFFAGTEGLDSILLKLAEKWGTLDFETQRYIATTAAGSRQQSRFIAMMSDYARTTELVAEAQNSAGASQMQFNKTQDSMESKLQRLENAWDQFLMGLANNEVLKGAIDTITFIIESINDLTESISGGKGLTKSLVSLIGVVSTLKMGKNAFGKTFGLSGVYHGKFAKGGKNGPDDLSPGTALLSGFFKKVKRKDQKTDGTGTQFQKATEGANNLSKSLSEAGNQAQKTGEQVQTSGDKIDEHGDKTDNAAAKSRNLGSAMQGVGIAAIAAGSAVGLLSSYFESQGLEEAAETCNQISSILTGVGAILLVLPGLFNGVAKAAHAAGLKTWQGFGWLGIILFLVVSIGVAIAGWAKILKEASGEGQLEKMKDQLQDLDTAAEDAKNKLDEITDAKKELESLGQAFDNLTRGSREWQQALIENNQKVLELINTYPQLATEVSKGINGELTISETGWNSLMDQQQEIYTDTLGAKTAMSQWVQEKEQYLKTEEIMSQTNGHVMGKDIADVFASESSRNTITKTGVAVGALGGMALGAALGSSVPIIGTVIGAVLGGLTGLVANYVGEALTDPEDIEREQTGGLTYDEFNEFASLASERGLSMAAGDDKEDFEKVYFEAGFEGDFDGVWASMQNMGNSFDELANSALEVTLAERARAQSIAASIAQTSAKVQGSEDFGLIAEEMGAQAFENYDDRVSKEADAYLEALSVGNKNLDKGDAADAIVKYAKIQGIEEAEVRRQIEQNEITKEEIASVIAASDVNEEMKDVMENTIEIMERVSKDKSDREVAKLKGLMTDRGLGMALGTLGAMPTDEAGMLKYLESQGFTADDAIDLGYESMDAFIQAMISNVKNAQQTFEQAFGAENTFGMDFETPIRALNNVLLELGSASGLTVNQAKVLANTLAKITANGGDVSAVLSQFPELLAGLSGQKLEAAINLLTTTDWTTQDGIETTIAALKNLGVAIDDQMVEKLYIATKAVKKFDLAQLEEKLKNLSELKDTVSEKAESGSRSYTKEERDALIAGGFGEKDFVRIDYDEYTFMGETETLLASIENYTSQILGKMQTDVNEAVEKGEGFEAAFKSTKTYDVGDGTAGSVTGKKMTAEEIITKLTTGELDTLNVGGTNNVGKETLKALIKDTGALEGVNWSGFSDHMLAEALIQGYSDHYGLAGTILNQNREIQRQNETDSKTDQYIQAVNTQDFYKMYYQEWQKFAEATAEGLKFNTTMLAEFYNPDIDGVNPYENLSGSFFEQSTFKNNGEEIIGQTIGFDPRKLLETIATQENFSSQYEGDPFILRTMRTLGEQVGIKGASDMNFATMQQELTAYYESMMLGEQVLDALIISETGLDLVLQQTNETLTEQGINCEKNSVMTKKLVLSSNQANKSIDEMNEVLEDQSDILKSGNKNSDAYKKSLFLITNAAKKVFGKHITADFIEENIKLFEDLAEGGEAAAAAWETISEKSGQAYLETLNLTEEQLSGIETHMAALDGMNLDIGGSANFSDIFTQLANVMNSADEAEAYIESLGGYEVEWVPAGSTINELTGEEMPNYIAIVKKTDQSGTGSRPTGGGGGGGKWENSYDKLHNVLEEINDLLRERETLERRYQRLVERGAATAEELSRISKTNVQNYKEEIERQKDVISGRESQIEARIKSNPEMEKYVYTETDQLGNRTLRIDWQAINAISNQKEGEKVTEFYEDIDTWLDSIYESQEAILDAEDAIWEELRQGKDEYLDLEEQVKEAIVAQRQEELDKLSSINDSINDTNTELLDAMQQSVDKYRQDRDNAKTEEELADKQRRLAYLQQDTSGANDLEIKKLQEELEQGQQDYTDTLIDQKISELQQQNDEAAEQRQQQIDLMQAQLDQYVESGEIWKEVTELISAGTSATQNLISGSELEGLLRDANNFAGMSNVQKMAWLQDTNVLIAQALKWLSDGAVSTFSTGQEVTFTTADGQTITGKANAAGEVEADGQIYEDVSMDAYGNYSTKETVEDAKQNFQDKEEEEHRRQEEAEYQAKFPYGIVPSQNSRNLRIGHSGTDVKALQDALNQLGYDCGEVDGQFGGATAQAVKKFQIDAKNKGWNPNIGYPDGVVGAETRKALAFKKYKTGGLADFTGPAWLDGTKSRPEYVLNADQTKAFFNLIDVLGSLQSGNSKTTQNSGDNTYDIDINVESIGSDYDVEQLADTVKRLINEDARYRNNNAINLMR